VPNVYHYDLEIFSNCFMASFQKQGSEEIKTVTVHPSKATDRLSDLLALFRSGGFFVGYNSRHFDDPIMHYILETSFGDRQEFLRRTFKKAQEIISGHGAKRWKYDVPFRQIDLMQVGNLYTKSLKEVAINLKWHRIQDFPYDFNHEVQADEIEELRAYNHNDVGITAALFEELKDDIDLRVFISREEGVDVIDASNQKIADVLLEKKYSQATGVPARIFTKDQTTYDSHLEMEKIIEDDVDFSHRNFSALLEEMKEESIMPGDSFKKEVPAGEQLYTVAKGGLHSNHDSEWIEPAPGDKLIDADVSSYYPFLVFRNNYCPEHLSQEFVDILEKITLDRIKDKKEENWTASASKKIIINAVYGKSRDHNSWMHDPMVTYQVTINGQLYLLMLIDKLEQAGFPVVYANTDGVTARVDASREDQYRQVCKEWEEETGFLLDYEEFNWFALADVNNFLAEKKGGKMKRKGRFNKNRHVGTWGLGRSFDMPIVPIAIEEYFTGGTPPEETIAAHDDVLDFCTTQSVGKKFDVVYETIEDNRLMRKECQQTNRWYIAEMGGALIKKTDSKKQLLESGEHVRLLNTAPTPEDRKAVREDYYAEKAYQEIKPIDHEQLSLAM